MKQFHPRTSQSCLSVFFSLGGVCLNYNLQGSSEDTPFMNPGWGSHEQSRGRPESQLIALLWAKAEELSQPTAGRLWDPGLPLAGYHGTSPLK